MEIFAIEMSKLKNKIFLAKRHFANSTSLERTEPFLHTYSNCTFHEICRPENPQRRTSIELEDIKKSLRDNGCWPFHPSGPILLDSEDDENDTSPIVKKTARGASKNSRYPVPSTSQVSNDAVPSTSQESNLTVGKGKGKGKALKYLPR